MDFEVIVIGAGLSGIDAGYHLQQAGRSYTILEARDDLGGTWDLFRYPGIRSDSDLYTLGFPFRPWTDEKSLADGETILRYLRDTAAEFGIDRHIQYGSRVIRADFDTTTATWTVHTPDRKLTSRFLYSCSGYYDYEHPYEPDLPGLADFAGTFIHPQFWPADLDYSGKRIVVIGSGATAVTLVPALAQSAAHVTMLQRSPTWVVALPPKDPLADAARRWLPGKAAHRFVRGKNITLSSAFYQFCRRFPKAAARMLHRSAVRQLGDEQLVDEAFTPSYRVWDQRLCVMPDGDLFRMIKQGRADVVTDQIDRFVDEGIRLRSGDVLAADIVVSATGLQLLPLGGVKLTVDGVPVDTHHRFVFLGAMLSAVPNFAVAVGYSNASWTLRADLTSRLVCKVLAWMDDRGYRSATPYPDRSLRPEPLMSLQAGYIQRAAQLFPQQGNRWPWRMRQNYVLDAATTLRVDLDKHLSGNR